MLHVDDFETYLNLSPTVFFKCNPDEQWSVRYVSRNVETLLGYTQEEFMNQSINCMSLIHKNDLPLFSHEVAHFSHSDISHFKHTPYRLITKNGKVIWVEKNTQIVRDEQGRVCYFFGYVNDITSLKASNTNLEIYKQILDANNNVTMSDLEGNIIYANEAFLKSSGYTLEEILGKPHNILRHPSTPAETFKSMWGNIKEKKTWHGILKSKKKNGSSMSAKVSISPLLDHQGNIEKYIGIRHDVTELIEATEALRVQSQTDNLTGLGNRFKLLQDIEKAHQPFLAIFDIVRFGEINDFYGYKIGDELITAFAQRLLSLTQNNFLLYRINADEFALLSDNMEFDEVLTLVQKLHFSLSNQALHVKDKRIVFSIITALSLERKEDLLSTADIAKNYAKNNNIPFCQYTKTIELAKEYEQNIYWASKIKEALDEDKITTFFQPIFNNKTKKIEKYEALVRIVDGDEIISPFRFLDIAKKTRQYIEITKRVIQKSFEVFAQKDLDFSINLTMEDILSDELKLYLWKSVHAYNVHKKLILEIVESEGIKDMHSIEHFLQRAKECGCRLAIDDFGTGYSNFEYLIKLNATYIKIDGSIIQKMHGNDGAMDVTKAIISFAQARGMKTIAEFVSTKEIFDTICDLGIDYSQGYYIGEPKPYLL